MLTTGTWSRSQVSKAVSSWRSGLESKNRKKLAKTIASPDENPELFEEGWESALERQKGVSAQRTVTTNGVSGKFHNFVLFVYSTDWLVNSEHEDS